MKLPLSLLLAFWSAVAWAQTDPNKAVEPIVAEGKLLYRCEMASWYGTDIFLAQYPDKEKAGGYFSYLMGERARCVFFSKTAKPTVIATIDFEPDYDLATAKFNPQVREFTSEEQSLYEIREIALEEINSDTLFKAYSNSNLNLIPLISGSEKKVYVLTGPTNRRVLFGNDYLLTFNKKNKVTSKQSLHNNLIPVDYDTPEQGKSAIITMHSHNARTGDFITATDVCTLMLYCKLANWKSHYVVSEGYVNIWDCESQQVVVLTKEAFKRIYEHSQGRNGGKKPSDN